MYLILILSGLAACRANAPSETQTVPTVVAPVLATQSTKIGQPTPGSSPSILPSTILTLTLWAPDFFSTGTNAGGPIIHGQVNEFEQAHPKISVDVVTKNRYGQGGMLDFLLKVQSLVPSRLPDLVLIDSRELDSAQAAGLLQPIDRDLPAGSFADLIPPADTIGSYEGNIFALPIVLDVQHLVYNSTLVHQAPATLDQVIQARAGFAFPADGDDGFLFQYMESGGQLSEEGRSTILDVGITSGVLGFFQRARSANVITDTVLGFKSTDDAWQAFASGQFPLAQVSANNYLSGHERVANTAYAPLPTRDGRATTIVSGWAYVIVTSDRQRHDASAQFLQWMDDPARVAEWAAPAHLVPARRSAFALAMSEREYADFLLKLIESGMPAPSFAERAPFASAWRTALQSVMRGQATPAEAALKAAQSATP